MARPKTGEPIKQKLTLTVSSEVREALAEVSQSRQMSISELVAEYAIKEQKKARKQASKGVTNEIKRG